MQCLKCGSARNLQDLQCPECGVFYAKYDVSLEKKLKPIEELERNEQECANTEENPTPENKKIGCLAMIVEFFILVFLGAR